MKPLIYHPDVDREVAEAVDFYESRKTGLGRRFIHAYLEAISKIEENPLTGFLSSKGTRTLMVRGFPFGIVFRESPQWISIAAVYHFSHQEDYWADRIEDEESL